MKKLYHIVAWLILAAFFALPAHAQRITDPVTYLYKPLAFTMPKQFYSPKYTVTNKNTAIGTDMRSTVYWEPNIITDAAGKATVSFYSADKATGYSVVVEGTDMQGQLGHKKAQIVISK